MIYPAFQVLFPKSGDSRRQLGPREVDVPVRETRKTGGVVFENRNIRVMVKSS